MTGPLFSAPEPAQVTQAASATPEPVETPVPVPFVEAAPEPSAAPGVPASEAPAETPEAPDAEPAGATRRGRPRSQETLARDEAVWVHLREHGPLTRQQLAETLGTTPNLIYLSLWRLSRVARVAVDSDGDVRFAWRAVVRTDG